MTSSEEMHCLTDLFHYDPAEKKGSDLQKGLKEYQFLLKASSHAIQYLLDGHLEKFDALVGENACHIRAIKIAMIATKDKANFVGLKQKIEKVSAAIEALLELETINCFMLEQVSLIEVISQE